MVQQTSNYPCSQSVLYTTNDLIIMRLRENITDFSDFRGIYNDEFCDLLSAANANSRNLPNEQMRTLAHQAVRNELALLNKDCCNKYQRLKRYIAARWPKNEEEYWIASGWNFYEQASGQSWSKTIDLNNAGSQFIAANAGALLENENMPATFPEDYNAACEAFSAKLEEFIAKEQDSQTGTFLKILSNNGIFARIMQVCMDAKVIYADDETMLNLFSFSAVSSLVEPAGASTAAITVLNDETNLPIVAEVQVVGSDKSTITDASTGRCDITQLGAGSTNFVISANGFLEQPLTMGLETGVTSRATVRMIPAVIETGNANPQSLVGNGQFSQTMVGTGTIPVS